MSHADSMVSEDDPRTGETGFAGTDDRAGDSESAAPDASDSDAAHRELEDKAAMIEHGIAAVFAYDKNGRLLYSNHAGFKLCGAEDLAELQESEFPRVRTPGSPDVIPLFDYLAQGTSSQEVILEVKPAKLLPCFVSRKQLIDADGAPKLTYANILDFTDMNAYKARFESKNRELILANDRAEFANRTKSEFLANMSHELRTPLNAVIGFAEVISNASPEACDETVRDYASDIKESGQHLLDLVNTILDLSKAESGVDEISEEKIDIPRLVRSAVAMVKGRAQKGGVALEIEVPDVLPALQADNRKMKQILVNLLSNAIKFTEPGGAVTFKIWCKDSDGCVFQIADTGIGIALDDIPKALAPFQQVSGELNRKYEGTGLGLPLTKCLTELHGGSLDLQSRLGVGTTVTVRLPEERIIRSQ